MRYSQLPHWKQPLTLMEEDDGGSGGSNGGQGGSGGDGGTGDGDDKGGAGGGDWREALPEDVRGWEEVKNSDSPEKFWQQISSHRQHLGRSIRIPSEDAGQEDWNKFYEKLTSKVTGLVPRPDPDKPETIQAFYRAMGHPEKPDGYKPPEFENQDKLDMAPVEMFRNIAHKYNLTQKQFEGIVKEVTEANIQSAEQRKADADSNMKALSDEWGAAFDKNMRFIQNVVQKTDGPSSLLDAIVQGRIDADSAKWILEIGKSLGGEKVIMALDKDGKRDGVMTPAEARERITEIMNNRDHAYWNQRDPGHKTAVARMVELQKMANPDASTDINELRAGARSA